MTDQATVSHQFIGTCKDATIGPQSRMQRMIEILLFAKALAHAKQSK
jgi:hypothetical protein